MCLGYGDPAGFYVTEQNVVSSAKNLNLLPEVRGAGFEPSFAGSNFQTMEASWLEGCNLAGVTQGVTAARVYIPDRHDMFCRGTVCFVMLRVKQKILV